MLDLGTIPDVGGFWSFTFETKINSLPIDSNWYFQLLSVKKDFNGFPYELTSVNYSSRKNAHTSVDYTSFAWMVTQGSIHSPNFEFEVDKWYKITITGRPKGAKCEQTILVEGPGLRGWFSGKGYVDGKWTYSNTNVCLDLEGYSLKVMATRDLTYASQTPVDGVVRNVVFINDVSEKTIVSDCYEEVSSTQVTTTTVKTTTTTPPPGIFFRYEFETQIHCTLSFRTVYFTWDLRMTHC